MHFFRSGSNSGQLFLHRIRRTCRNGSSRRFLRTRRNNGAPIMLIRFNERISAFQRIRITEVCRNNRLVMQNKSAPATRGTLLGKRFDKPLTDALSGHLHKPERRDFGNLMLSAVSCQTFDQPAQNQVSVRRQNHIDKINHDHSADIAKSQLPHNFLCRLKIASCDSLFERLAFADISSCIHIHCCHGFRAIYDQTSA